VGAVHLLLAAGAHDYNSCFTPIEKLQKKQHQKLLVFETVGREAASGVAQFVLCRVSG